jgi:hypothetical protein
MVLNWVRPRAAQRKLSRTTKIAPWLSVALIGLTPCINVGNSSTLCPSLICLLVRVAIVAASPRPIFRIFLEMEPAPPKPAAPKRPPSKLLSPAEVEKRIAEMKRFQHQVSVNDTFELAESEAFALWLLEMKHVSSH